MKLARLALMNIKNGFRSKLDIPVSLDTKCTFCGVSHDSVENAQKSIQNGKTDNFDPPPPEKELW